MSSNLVSYRWPKHHEWCVEQCAALHVTTVLSVVDAATLGRHRPWIFPELPFIRLIARPGGACVRWWFLCPGCGARCESLYRPPTATALEWRCRHCHSLVYASQRYGYRHPLRKDARNWTHRKRRTAQHRLARSERWLRAHQDRLRREHQATLPPITSDVDVSVMATAIKQTLDIP